MPVVGRKTVQKVIVDSEFSTLTSIEDAFDEFERKVKKAVPQRAIKTLASRVTHRNHKRNKKIWIDKLSPLSEFGINISKKASFSGEQAYISSRIKTNTSLIKSLKDDYVQDLNTLLFSSYQKGTPIKQLAGDIQNQYGITKRRAKLIARNETKNTNTQLNKKQGKELFGDSPFKPVWLGSEDIRERDQHNKHNNKEYEFGVGLDDGKGGKEEPGDAINCRCDYYIDIK